MTDSSSMISWGERSGVFRVTSLNLPGRGLTGTLDVSSLSALRDLYCHNNQLTELDVANLSNLEYLHCDSNQLTELDVANLINLKSLYCSGNQLTELDVANLTNLTTLSCQKNPLVTLSLPAVPPTYIDGVNRIVVLVPDKTNYADLLKFPAGTHVLLESEYSVTVTVNSDDALTLSANIAGTNRYQWQKKGTSDWEDVAGAIAAVYETDLASAADLYRLKFYFTDDAAGIYDFYTAPLDIAQAAPISTSQTGLTDNPAPGNITTIPAGTTNVSWTFTINSMYDLTTVKLTETLPSGVSLSLAQNAITRMVTVSGTVSHGTSPYTIDLKLLAKKTEAIGATDTWYESPAYTITVAASIDIPPTASPDISKTSPDVPSVAPDKLLELQNNTTIKINFNSTGQIVSLAVVSSNGSPIPVEVWFQILLLVQPENTGAALDYDVSTLADEKYYGPFLVKSASNASGGTKLDIDVDNLKKPNGSKGFIPAGSYKVKFADNSSSPVYVGMTEVIELPATSLS
ncbi:MAG: leucine-rich repeat domain-containing protein, partial [Synergistaceae bacterium]|nr:leucine-rich repeat domain-containing protein [Synergistaceae bacterium]